MRKLFFSMILCLGGGWLTGWLTQAGVKDWYPHLIKPYGTPPNIVFPVVWTILYFLMAISLTLLWRSRTNRKKLAFSFFGLQLFLNFIWSWLFFYLQKPFLALVDITALWICILMTVVFFWRHTPYGSGLLIPYLIWVAYAFYLNIFIWILN